MSRVALEGLIRVPPDRLDAVLAELDTHIRLTREEEGCLAFRVDQRSDEPSVFDVYEEFVDRASFEAHQARVNESRWAACTKGLVREYTVTEAWTPGGADVQLTRELPQPGVETVPRRNKGPSLALVDCGECGTQYSDRAKTCSHCGAPAANALQRSGKHPYLHYDEVPWWRTSRVNTLFILGSFISGGTIPTIGFTCIALASGNVYYEQRNRQGHLKTWGAANKVAAWALMVGNIALGVYYMFAG